MKRPGEITDVKNGMLLVTFCRPEACQTCGACEGGKRQTRIWVKGNGHVGDIAVVDMPDSMVIRASLIAYGLPLLFLLLGLVAGTLLFPDNDVAAILGALLGLGLSLILLKVTERYRAGQPQWSPEVTQIIPRNENTDFTEGMDVHHGL